MINGTRLFRSAMFGCATLAAVGCGSDTAGPAIPSDAYASLTLNVHSVKMSIVAPYDTIRLVATARTASGQTVLAGRRPLFTVSDSTITVDSTGLLRAVATTPRSYVVVSLQDTLANITRKDTMFVMVTNVAAPVHLASFAVQLLPGDSARLALGGGAGDLFKQIIVAAQGVDGSNLTDSLMVLYRVSDPSVATIDPRTGVMSARIPARIVTVFATTTYYGTSRTDSLRITTGYTILGNVNVSTYIAAKTGVPTAFFSPHTVTIGVGGSVQFGGATLPMDVVFDDPSAAQPSDFGSVLAPSGTGNIGIIQFPEDIAKDFLKCFDGEMMCAATRAFPRAGVFPFHSSVNGATGVVVVKSMDDPE